MQRTLFSLGVKRKQTDDESEQENEPSAKKAHCESNVNTRTESGEKSKSERSKRERKTWNDSWFRTFPWIEKNVENGEIRAMCAWCKKANRKNALTTGGTENLQSSTFSRHENTREHLLASEAYTAQKKKLTIQHVVEKVNEAEISSDPCKEAQMNTMYYLAKEGQPIHQYNNILKLQIKNKCPDLQETSKLYTSEEAKSDMLDAINSVIEENIDSHLHESDFLGLIVDESTDISVHKKLNVYVKCVFENKPKVHFLECINVPDGKAETIVSEIVKLFEKKNLPISKLLTLASDGASVMTGRHSGVGARLKESSPHMIQVHCVAHRLALAAGQACKDVSLFSEYQQTLKSVYRFFSNSAVRYNELRQLMEILEDDSVKYVTLKEPASFRWLSLEGAVSAIDSSFPAVYQALEHEAAKGNADAKGLLKKVKSVGFVLTTGFLKDVLCVLGKLSKVFQREQLDINVVNTQVEITVVKLESFKMSSGTELEKVYEGIKSGEYRGVKLTDTQNFRIGFQNSSATYLDRLVDNVKNRFDDKSMQVLQDLNKILNPTGVPKNISDLCKYGEQELKSVIEQYGGENGIIDGERARDNYLEFKILLKSLTLDLSETCSYILQHYPDVYPDFAVLAKIMLVSPLTSVACERGFSVHNQIKTKGRSRLGHATVTKLMRIKQEGPELSEFDPKKTVYRFLAMKKRRK